jgi:hypothetical protein
MKTVGEFHFEATGAQLKKAYQDRIEKEVEQIERLIDAAMDVLHHDRSEDSEVDVFEREQLRNKFAAIMGGRSGDKGLAS